MCQRVNCPTCGRHTTIRIADSREMVADPALAGLAEGAAARLSAARDAVVAGAQP